MTLRIHKEGYATLLVVFVFLAIINVSIAFFIGNTFISILFLVISIGFYGFILQFFRYPKRNVIQNKNLVLSPADGKVVVIEETEEPEYFKDKRIQVSIFMSPMNVHINYFPVSGIVSYFKYHKGKYLVAWHPKSSTLNERSTVVVKMENGTEILFRQIAGAVARRVVCYPKVNDNAVQGCEFGFIKFGSRVDIFLPLGTEIRVALDEMVTGSQNIIARLKS